MNAAIVPICHLVTPPSNSSILGSFQQRDQRDQSTLWPPLSRHPPYHPHHVDRQRRKIYWGKLDKGTAIFKAGNPEEAQDLCLQLSDDFRCPRPIHATLLVEPNKQARAIL